MRYLILSDIHSNLGAFEAVLADAGPFDMIWCLGDVIGYGPQPNECIERLKALPHVCIAGNHDWAAIDKLDISAFNPDAMRACLWTREQLSPSNWDFIEKLPEKHIEDRFTLVHGSPRHPIWEYITSSSVAAANFSYFDSMYCFFGHTHIPAVHRSTDALGTGDSLTWPLDDRLTIDAERLLINPGGVGQPRDMDPRASYMVLDLEQNRIEHRRIAYPVEETQQLMLSVGLPPRLAMRLSVGW